MKKLKIGIILLAMIMILGAITACGGGAQVAESTTAGAADQVSSETTEAAAEDTTAEATEASSEETASETEKAEASAQLEDGTYLADFNTDSSMFHVNEANEGKGILTVKDGEMSIHVAMPSDRILQLFAGLAEDAEKEGAALIDHTIDTVTYSDGMSEEVHAFDIPVPYLDEEFDCALIGEKGKWYDHKVSVSNPVPYVEEGAKVEDVTAAEETEAAEGDAASAGDPVALEDGSYMMDVTLDGGTGKATVDSPTPVAIKDGKATATITWSSPNYDYMIVNEEKLLPVNEEGNSVFEIPVDAFDTPLEVVANTVAMSKPHEIDYTLIFDSASATPAE